MSLFPTSPNSYPPDLSPSPMTFNSPNPTSQAMSPSSKHCHIVSPFPNQDLRKSCHATLLSLVTLPFSVKIQPNHVMSPFPSQDSSQPQPLRLHMRLPYTTMSFAQPYHRGSDSPTPLFLDFVDVFWICVIVVNRFRMVIGFGMGGCCFGFGILSKQQKYNFVVV